MVGEVVRFVGGEWLLVVVGWSACVDLDGSRPVYIVRRCVFLGRSYQSVTVYVVSSVIVEESL